MGESYEFGNELESRLGILLCFYASFSNFYAHFLLCNNMV